MAFNKIPTRSDFPAYSQRVELDSVIYNLVITYNERMDRWFLDIQDQEEVDILSGIPMLTGIPLLQQYTKEDLPPGDFMLLHRDGIDNDANAKRDDLGDSVNLFYIDAEDLV